MDARSSPRTGEPDRSSGPLKAFRELLEESGPDEMNAGINGGRRASVTTLAQRRHNQIAAKRMRPKLNTVDDADGTFQSRGRIESCQEQGPLSRTQQQVLQIARSSISIWHVLAKLLEPPYTRPVRTVVWEERRREAPPIPIYDPKRSLCCARVDGEPISTGVYTGARSYLPLSQP